MHKSVLLRECIEALNLKPGDTAIDCTVGAGGHTEAMLQAVTNTGTVIGLDQDDSALEIAGSRLAKFVDCGVLKLVKSRFSEISSVGSQHNIVGKVQGILADIGVSSMHLDQADRGFSFASEGPLDMRMDPTQKLSAHDIVNDFEEAELFRILKEYGEEPKAFAVAKGIIQARQDGVIQTTLQLANIVKKSARYSTKSRKHPATRTFQALRIAVNDELGEIDRLVQKSLELLQQGGRLAVISFHSLEDRIVKRAFRKLSGKGTESPFPRGLPVQEAEKILDYQIIKPFPLVPTDTEISENPRARSAKLRVIEKL